MGNKPVSIPFLSTIQSKYEMDAYLKKHRILDDQVGEVLVECIACNMNVILFHKLLDMIGFDALNSNYDAYSTYLTDIGVSREIIYNLTGANMLRLYRTTDDKAVKSTIINYSIKKGYVNLAKIIIDDSKTKNLDLSKYYKQIIDTFDVQIIEAFCKYDPGFDLEKLMTKTQQRTYERLIAGQKNNVNNRTITHRCESGSNPLNTMLNTAVALNTARMAGAF